MSQYQRRAPATPSTPPRSPRVLASARAASRVGHPDGAPGDGGPFDAAPAREARARHEPRRCVDGVAVEGIGRDEGERAERRALLRRATGSRPAPVAAGDLRIDPGERRAWRGDIEIDLTSRQFDVLEFLVRRAGQVLSKTEILNGVWEYGFEGDPNIVEVYIRRLRTRIDEPFERHSIETIRGAGYRLTTNGW